MEMIDKMYTNQEVDSAEEHKNSNLKLELEFNQAKKQSVTLLSHGKMKTKV